MEDYKEKWQQCQQLIQQQLNDPWLWPVWFRPVACERFDPQKRALLLNVPSVYVYEFLEHYYVRLMKWAITETFGEGVTLRYRVLQNADALPVEYTLDAGACRTFLKVPDAAMRLRSELTKRLQKPLQWLPAYDRVARWLSDNKGRGLLCIGTSGLGKTLICRDVLPAILQQRGIVQCHADDMAPRIDELLKARCVIIDDLGKEKEWYFKDRNNSFSRLCTEAERTGALLIVTTGLSTEAVSDPRYPDSLARRYGADVLSRLHSLVLPVLFEGSDMRHFVPK